MTALATDGAVTASDHGSEDTSPESLEGSDMPTEAPASESVELSDEPAETPSNLDDEPAKPSPANLPQKKVTRKAAKKTTTKSSMPRPVKKPAQPPKPTHPSDEQVAEAEKLRVSVAQSVESLATPLSYTEAEAMTEQEDSYALVTPITTALSLNQFQRAVEVLKNIDKRVKDVRFLVQVQNAHFAMKKRWQETYSGAKLPEQVEKIPEDTTQLGRFYTKINVMFAWMDILDLEDLSDEERAKLSDEQRQLLDDALAEGSQTVNFEMSKDDSMRLRDQIKSIQKALGRPGR